MIGSKSQRPLIIIDGYGFIFRAYHVQPPLVSPDGTPVGAIYGFTSMLIKVINDFKPEHAVVVLDSKGKNFRHDIFPRYKANRPPAPEELVVQLELVQQAAEALNFKCLAKSGFEADDIIATLATKASFIKKDTIIISSDKDLMQLVDKHVKMYDPTKSKYINDEDILAKFGVTANKVREVQALMGDSSDNIPGVAGIGPKTAAQLINSHGSIKEVFKSFDNLTLRHQKLLKDNKETAILSWNLVGLDHNVDIDKDIENFHWKAPELTQIASFLHQHGFKSLERRIETLFNLQIINKPSTENNTKSHESNFQSIQVTDPKQLIPLINIAKEQGYIAVYLKKHNDNLSLTISDGHNTIYIVDYYQDMVTELNNDLFSYSANKVINIEIIQIVHSMFSDKAIKKITYNVKELMHSINCTLHSFEDLMLMYYVANAGKSTFELNDIFNLDQKELENTKIIKYFCTYYHKLKNNLIKNNILHLYESVDLPLSYILHDMEQLGIQVNISLLNKLSLELSTKINTLKKEVFAIAGQEFNIASPQQLGQILFEHMKLPFGKVSSKSKNYSTNVDVLEKLHIEGYEIAQLLLEYRHLTKLKNTYTDKLPKQVKVHTNRIHTTFLQCSTSTGRLSSVHPNVQNIPTRTEEGNKIRSAFIAKDGCQLISADYSQIELRIFSHVANIEVLKQAFIDKKDIHAQTASQIFNLPLEQITPDIRRKAKAINFGIIYGISAFGLAKQLGISSKEAAEYIKRYFTEYPGIQTYMSDTIEFAKTNGFVQNLCGRKCFIPTINSSKHTLRSFGERAAINAPIQSLAADIVKMAMININKALYKRNLSTRMTLQIHDELIFESPNDEINTVMPLIKSTMQKQYIADIDLSVTINHGSNWEEIH